MSEPKMTAKQWALATGCKFQEERERFTEFAQAVKALAPSIPSMVLDAEDHDWLAFTYVGVSCRLRFVFQAGAGASGSYAIIEGADGGQILGGFAVLLDAEGNTPNLGAEGLTVPHDAEAVFFILLRGARG